MAEKKILVVIGTDDGHDELLDLPDDRVVRLDPESIPSGTELSYGDLDGRSLVLIDGSAVDVCAVLWQWPGPEVARDGLPVRSIDPAIWQERIMRRVAGGGLERFRRRSRRRREVESLLSDLNIEVSVREHKRQALLRHLRDLHEMFPGALWINDPLAIERVRSKPAQLMRARAAGLDCPDSTWQTSSGAKAHGTVRRLDAYGHEAVCKDVTKCCPLTADGDPEVFWTTHVAPDDEDLEWDLLATEPKIIQQFVPGTDIRVTIVGDELFPAEIIVPESAEIGLIRDHRALGQAVDLLELDEKVRRTTLPDEVRDGCLALHHVYGLQYSAIDLRLTPDRRYVFLDLNAENTAFGWIEQRTGYPIGRAISRRLLAGPRD